MGKYIKKFDTHSDYEDFIETEDFIKPNVSYCIDNVEVHYNPWIDPRLIVRYNVEDTSNPTPLFVGGESMGFPASAIYDKIEIDNVEINMSDLSPSEQGYGYVFESSGQHTIKYTLKDPTMIGGEIDEETGGLSKVGAMFMLCPITSVEIPDSVTHLGSETFYFCGGLTSITIPNSATNIDDDFLVACVDLATIIIDSNNNKYDSRNNCNAIIETATNTLITGCKNTVIPNTVTSIGHSAFYGSNLTSITIPNSITNIGQYAFEESSLTNITIPNSVTSINEGAFARCGDLTSVNIPTSITSISSNMFVGCASLTNITIPTSITSIGDAAFSNCSGLTSVTIPNSVTSIGSSAFDGCSNLTEITIPNSVTSIGDSAFTGCSDLTSVTIGNGITSIGNSAFQNCNSLTSVTIEATTPPTLDGNVFDTNANIYVPSTSVNTYKAASGWSTYASRIQPIPTT